MTPPLGTRDPDELLADLNAEQRKAVQCVRGPVVIEAGAGSGKTRVISRRAAYAAAIGAIDPNRMLLITFTEKAGAEMSRRIRQLGVRGAIANNVHSVALRQLRWLWPRFKDTPVPTLLPSPYRLVNAFLRSRAPNVNASDVVTEISWAKARALRPETYLEALAGREPGVPAELAAAAFADYERRKRAANLWDFDDLLTELTTLITDDVRIARLVRGRRNWFCVDEYQDTNPVQDALYSAWLGEGTDFCVVGDVDQAIFGFTGASADHLIGFARRFPDARRFELAANYRSSGAVLRVANELLAAERRTKRLRPTKPDGLPPTFHRFDDDEVEVNAVVRHLQKLSREGISFPEMAILFRLHTHKVPLEVALRAQGIPFRSADPFFARREVALAIGALASPAAGAFLSAIAAKTWSQLFGFDVTDSANAGDARWDSMNALLQIAAQLEGQNPAATPADLATELQARSEAEAGTGEGVELTTYHQAKGREWPVVFLPMLEEGILPDFRAGSSQRRADEWRLLYVGVTRAERVLWLTYAEQRRRGDKTFHQKRSSFLTTIWPAQQKPTPERRPWSLPEPSTGLNPVRWPPANTREITGESTLPRGARVVHRTLGVGTVWSVSGGTLAVRFDGKVRKLRWPDVATSGKLRRSTGG